MPKRSNALRNPIPRVSICRFSTVDFRAIIETSDGEVYTYNPSKRRPARLQKAEMGFHAGMWLQPAMAAACGDGIETVEAGEYPFTEALEHIQFRIRVHDALDFFLKSLDIDLTVELRRQCARFATRLLEEDAVRELVEPILMGTPLPRGFVADHGPTRGKAGEILKAMLEKWRE